MSEIKKKRGRPKKIIMPEETQVSPEVVEQAPVVEETATPEEVVTPESVIEAPAPEPVIEQAPVVEETAANAGDLSGFKSCMKCGRDEPVASPFNVYEDKKLCENCRP